MDEKENRLVELVLTGHPEAFEALVSPYRTSLLNLAYRLTGDIEDAREASQETLMKAFRYLGAFDRRRSFKNWLLGILANASRTIMRKKTRTVSFNPDLSSPDRVDPAALHQRKEACSRIMNILNMLTEREREVFLLRDIEDRTIRETSRILGCSSISIRTHLSTARKKIREVLR